MPNINETLKPKPNQKQKQQTAVKTHQRYFSCKFTSTSPLKDSRRPSINLERGAINKKK